MDQGTSYFIFCRCVLSSRGLTVLYGDAYHYLKFDIKESHSSFCHQDTPRETHELNTEDVSRSLAPPHPFDLIGLCITRLATRPISGVWPRGTGLTGTPIIIAHRGHEDVVAEAVISMAVIKVHTIT